MIKRKIIHVREILFVFTLFFVYSFLATFFSSFLSALSFSFFLFSSDSSSDSLYANNADNSPLNNAVMNDDMIQNGTKYNNAGYNK